MQKLRDWLRNNDVRFLKPTENRPPLACLRFRFPIGYYGKKAGPTAEVDLWVGNPSKHGGGQVLQACAPWFRAVTAHRGRGRRQGSRSDRPRYRGGPSRALPADRSLSDCRQQGGTAAASGAMAGHGARGQVGRREAANPHQDAVHEVRSLPADLRPKRRPLVPELYQDGVPVGPAAAAACQARYRARAGSGRSGPARRCL